MKKSPFLSVQPIPRDLKTMFPYQQQAGLLTYISSQKITFPVSQWRTDLLLHDYSDEIAQDFHLFPYYPDNVRHLLFFLFNCFDYTTFCF